MRSWLNPAAVNRRLQRQRELSLRRGDRVVGGLVNQAQDLFRMGQAVVDARGHLLQFLDGGDAGVDDQRAALGQQRIPVDQLLGVAAALAELFEQRVALGEGLAIFAQRLRIAWHGLRKGQVQVAAALFRPALDDARHLREEDHRGKGAHGFVDGALDPVQQDFFAQARGAARPRPIPGSGALPSGASGPRGGIRPPGAPPPAARARQ